MTFLRRLGIPAPHEAHARLWVNGQYAGLYGLVEPVDETFAQRALGESSSALFEYHWLAPFFATFPGESLEAYRPLFEPRTWQTKSTSSIPSASCSAGSMTWLPTGFATGSTNSSISTRRCASSRPNRSWPNGMACSVTREYPLLSGSSENVLMRRALEDPVLRQLYSSYVR
jgi:CotH protein